MSNLPLFDDHRTIAERFAEFDAAHPEVYASFRHFAGVMLARGHQHYSADGIMHIVRFHTEANVAHDGGFKINNNFVALYARKLAGEDERFRTFFAFRQRRSA